MTLVYHARAARRSAVNIAARKYRKEMHMLSARRFDVAPLWQTAAYVPASRNAAERQQLFQPAYLQQLLLLILLHVLFIPMMPRSRDTRHEQDRVMLARRIPQHACTSMSATMLLLQTLRPPRAMFSPAVASPSRVCCQRHERSVPLCRAR